MIVTRFAPSPTGYLHLGHAWSAFVGWRAARQAGGRFLLRLEDIDAGRCRPHFAEAVLEDLAWLGLDWDGPVRRQSEHLGDYAAALGRLQESGVVYPCFCSRAAIQAELQAAGHAPQGPEGPLYPGTCRALPAAERAGRIAAGAPHAWRIDAALAARMTGPLVWRDRQAGVQPCRPEALGDAVIAGRQATTSYHLSVTVDDHLQGVTLVTRGADLFTTTHLHRLLQALLGLDTPDYCHHRLVLDEHGQRLAKRTDARSIRAYRAAGLGAADILALAEPRPAVTAASP